MRFCKDVLGVQRQTSNTGVLLELGRLPLTQYAKKNCIKNWRRIHIQGKANKLVLLSHRESLIKKLIWSESVSVCLNTMGIQVPKRGKKLLEVSAWDRMSNIFYETTFVEMNREGSKLRRYKLLKTNIGWEGYLDEVKNFSRRRVITKIRLSNHRLMIEKGRHENLQRVDRVCPFCTQRVVEDEPHFIFDCPTYSHLRAQLYLAIEEIFPLFNLLPIADKLKIALASIEIVNYTGIFLEKAISLRDFLICKPRNSI